MKIICFGDILGLPQLLGHLPADSVTALVAAENRPQYHQELGDIGRAHGLSLIVQSSQKTGSYGEFFSRLQALAPDLILVHSYSMLLPPEVLALPRLGAINIHGALLPYYRGCNPIQWALCNNEGVTGVTMHYMDAGFDTGDIIAQQTVPIHFDDTWLTIRDRIVDATDSLLAEQVPEILAGRNGRSAQNEQAAKYWSRRKPEDGLIDWNWSCITIYNLIRALVFPHPGAYYVADEGTKIVLDQFLSYDTVRYMQQRIIGRIIE